MGRRQILKSGYEVDYLYHRHLFHWQRGEGRRISRGLNKRDRQAAKDEIRTYITGGQH